MTNASIATEAKVVNLLKEQGISKNDITRDEFLEHAWAWKEKYGRYLEGSILLAMETFEDVFWQKLVENDINPRAITVFINYIAKV